MLGPLTFGSRNATADAGILACFSRRRTGIIRSAAATARMGRRFRSARGLRFFSKITIRSGGGCLSVKETAVVNLHEFISHNYYTL